MGGALASLDATDLGGNAIAAALERAEVAPEQVEHVVFGQVLQAGQGQIPSRQAQIKGGIPKEVPSRPSTRCARLAAAAGMVDQSVRAGDLDVAVAGGMESMSSAPYLLKQARFGYRMGDAKALDAMVHDGPTNPFTGKHMGEEANEVGEEPEITARTWTSSRSACTSWRSRPPTRGAARGDRPGHDQLEEGRHHRRDRRGAAPRRACSRRCSKLRGAFHKDGAHTAGNAPGVNDGAGRARARVDEWAKAERPDAAGAIVAQARWQTSSPTWRVRPRTPRPRRSRRPACPWTTSTCSRSTRRSPRWRSTRCGCSAWTSRR